MKVSFRKNKKKSDTRLRYDWSNLTLDPISENFSITLTNRFDALNALTDEINPNSSYNNFFEATKHAANSCLPKREHIRQKLPWENNMVTQARNALRKASKSKNENPTAQNINTTIMLQRQQVYTAEKAKYIQEKIDMISEAAESQKSSLAWQTVNKITGRKYSSTAKLKGDSQQQRLHKWRDHF